MLGFRRPKSGPRSRKACSSSSTVQPALCQRPLGIQASDSSSRNVSLWVNVNRECSFPTVHNQPNTAHNVTSHAQHRKCLPRHAVIARQRPGRCRATGSHETSNSDPYHSSHLAPGPPDVPSDSSSVSGSGGDRKPPWTGTTVADNDDNSSGGQHSNFTTPQALIYVAIGLGTLATACSVATLIRISAHTERPAPESVVNGGSSAGLSFKDSVAAVKRLLRELFTEQLNLRQRLDTLETTAAETLEAADDYELSLRGPENSRTTWSRSPVRISGSFAAAGVLPWSQEPAAADSLSMLTALGASGQADARLLLHSVLAGGKRRITAEISQAPLGGSHGSLPMMQLNKLLYRVNIKNWIHFMIAPLGGSLDAIARAVTPIHADYGCTHALKHGHGLSVFEHTGSGKAAMITRRGLSAAAGHFVGGTLKATCAQLQLQSDDGHSLSLMASHRKPRHNSSDSSIANSSSSSQRTGLRFLGVQAPHTAVQDVPNSSSSNGSGAGRSSGGTVLGAVGVVPIRESFTATAWAEKPLAGTAGWGLGMYSQPDADGVEVGLVLGRPTSHHTAFRAGRLPIYCELSAKVPVGEGLSISPGALALYGTTSNKITLAYLMQSCWRF